MTPCSRPILKNCSGEGRTECRTEYETSCSATYPAPAADSAPAPASCVKLPVSFCGRGCVTAAGEEQCSEKTTDVLREVPGHTHNILNIESNLTKVDDNGSISEETCELSPRQVCRPVTRLLPSLKPTKHCTQVNRARG